MEAQEALIIVRFWHYASALALFGAALFPTYAFPPGAPRPPVFDEALRRAGLLAAVSALVSGGLWLTGTAASMAGDMAAASDWTTVRSVALDTAFGRIWLVRLALAAVLTGLTLLRHPPARLVLVLAAVLVASLAATGHTRTAVGPQAWLHMSSDALHLLAGGVWFGAIGALAFLLRQDAQREATVRALNRFAGVGAAAVTVLVATGALNAWLIVGDVLALWTHPYGRLLTAKVGLFLAMLALAAANRFWLTPVLARRGAPYATTGLKLSIALEYALAVGVLALVAVIGTLDPAA